MTTKTDLTLHVATTHGVSQAKARGIVDDVLGFIADRVAAGETVALKGFGTFEARDSKARMGRNPRTGEAVPIPASTRMAFRAAKKAGA